ncbi:hypothetical protein SK128_027308 [Halocaridina rubra]|uniref:Uncharacterized protein n=1 Tax=Halocaridina rubra TaxID=373956 RepID=A0AAN8X0I7_HALRR
MNYYASFLSYRGYLSPRTNYVQSFCPNAEAVGDIAGDGKVEEMEEEDEMEKEEEMEKDEEMEEEEEMEE